MSEKLKSAVEAAVATAVKAEIRNPANALDAAPGHVEQAANAVAERALDSAELQHLTSSEAWYRSRANWAAIISFATPIIAWIILKVTGVEWAGLNPRDVDMVTLILSTVGGFVASYLARRARTATRPIGKGSPP